jgi:hypothetical protein
MNGKKSYIQISPSGRWEVLDGETGKTLYRFGNSECDRLIALAVSYKLNGWKISKWLEPYYEKVKDKIRDEEL